MKKINIMERIRQEIIEPYKLTDVQAKFRVYIGDDIYAENMYDNAFIMMSGVEGKVRVKNLFSGKEALCELQQFIDYFSEMKKRGFKFYDADSYNKLIERGYKLQYDV